MINKEILNRTLETSKLYLQRAKSSYNRLDKIKINTELLSNEEKARDIDSFIFRFLKLQDFMGQKLFKQTLELTDDYNDNMSMIDVLDKLEKMELISSSEKWSDYRKMRNKLTHEYPDNQEELIKGIELALRYFPEIENIVIRLQNYLEGLNKIK